MSLERSRLGSASFNKKTLRILKLSKKPSRREVFQTIKISSAGMMILGLVGYIIRLILYYVLDQGPV